MSQRLIKLGTLASLALAIGGCTTLGGNVKGDFACRAPEGSCAPTSAIDEQATKALQPQGANALSSSPTNGRTLRVVLAAWHDADGREHEARVVHVPLAEKPATVWRTPLSTGDVLARAWSLRARARPALPTPGDASSTATIPSSLPQQLPGRPGYPLPGFRRSCPALRRRTKGHLAVPPPPAGCPTLFRRKERRDEPLACFPHAMRCFLECSATPSAPIILRRTSRSTCLSDWLPYRVFDEGPGIYRNAHSKGFVLEVTPLIGADERAGEILGQFFSESLPQGACLQVLNFASPRIGAIVGPWFAPRYEQGGIYEAIAKARVGRLYDLVWKSGSAHAPFHRAPSAPDRLARRPGSGPCHRRQS